MSGINIYDRYSVMRMHTSENEAGDVVITIDADTSITLVGVHLAQLTSHMFVFGDGLPEEQFPAAMPASNADWLI